MQGRAEILGKAVSRIDVTVKYDFVIGAGHSDQPREIQIARGNVARAEGESFRKGSGGVAAASPVGAETRVADPLRCRGVRQSRRPRISAPVRKLDGKAFTFRPDPQQVDGNNRKLESTAPSEIKPPMPSDPVLTGPANADAVRSSAAQSAPRPSVFMLYPPEPHVIHISILCGIHSVRDITKRVNTGERHL